MAPQIVIVDDDDDARLGLADILSSEYPSVITAADGQLALDLFRSGTFHPDVILLDLGMPVLDGISFLQLRTLDPNLSSVPVIVITAKESIDPGLAETITAVLPKPVPLPRLLELIHTIVNEPAALRARTRSMSPHRRRDDGPPGGIERRRR